MSNSARANKRFNFLEVLACPYCRATLHRVKDSLTCGCGNVFPIVNGIPIFSTDKKQEQLNAYEHIKLDKQWLSSFASEQIPIIQEDMRLIGSRLRGALILDMGCGALLPTAPIKTLFRPRGIISIDFSYNMLKICGDLVLEALGISDEGILRGISDLNANRLPMADSALDFVVGRYVLHHLNNPVTVLKEVKRVLKPHGTVCFVETCESYIPIFSRTRSRYSPFRMPLHLPASRWKGVEDESKHLQCFDQPKHYYEWKDMFSRFFKIKYFGYPPSTEHIITNVPIIRRAPPIIKKLAVLAQFYARVLLEYTGILIIAEKEQSNRSI